jgi:acrylyl-CoA reductase (NADPH)
MCPIELRKQAWARLSWDLDPAKLSQITTEISLHQVIEEGAKLLGGQVRGRTVIKIEA